MSASVKEISSYPGIMSRNSSGISISITFTHARSPDYLAPVKIGFGTIYTFIANLTDFLAKGFGVLLTVFICTT